MNERSIEIVAQLFDKTFITRYFQLRIFCGAFEPSNVSLFLISFRAVLGMQDVLNFEINSKAAEKNNSKTMANNQSWNLMLNDERRTVNRQCDECYSIHLFYGPGHSMLNEHTFNIQYKSPNEVFVKKQWKRYENEKKTSIGIKFTISCLRCLFKQSKNFFVSLRTQYSAHTTQWQWITKTH